MIKIFDKLVSQQNQLYFKNIISSDEFPWYFPKGNDQILMHTLYSYPRGPQSSYHKQFKALFDAVEEKANIKIVQILKIRCKKVLNTKTQTLPQINEPDAQNYKTFIYNVEDSDGDITLFKENYDRESPFSWNLKNPTPREKLSGTQGTGVYFNGDIYHTINSKTTISFDFKIDDNYNN